MYLSPVCEGDQAGQREVWWLGPSSNTSITTWYPVHSQAPPTRFFNPHSFLPESPLGVAFWNTTLLPFSLPVRFLLTLWNFFPSLEPLHITSAWGSIRSALWPPGPSHLLRGFYSHWWAGDAQRLWAVCPQLQSCPLGCLGKSKTELIQPVSPWEFSILVSDIWCFQIVVLEKTLESPLDSKEINLVNPKGNQPWVFIGSTHAEAPILWIPDAKSWLIGKDLNSGKNWRQEQKGMTEDEMVR